MTSNRIEQRKRIHVADHDYYVEDPLPNPKFLGLRLGC
jgi:hypothetical protein